MTVGSDCHTGKTQYATKTQARQAARAGRSKGWNTVLAYLCPWCGCWHIGNRRSANSKARQR